MLSGAKHPYPHYERGYRDSSLRSE